jgi:hypothetical protein
LYPQTSFPLQLLVALSLMFATVPPQSPSTLQQVIAIILHHYTPHPTSHFYLFFDVDVVSLATRMIICASMSSQRGSRQGHPRRAASREESPAPCCSSKRRQHEVTLRPLRSEAVSCVISREHFADAHRC